MLQNMKNISNMWGKLAPFMSLGLMVIILTILTPYFLTVDNLFAIGLQMAVVAIMAIGQMMIIISAGIDLSVGSILALSGVTTTILLKSGIGIFPAILVGLFVGTLCGIMTGYLIAKGHLPPFIATLGMMGVARGVALLITGGVPVFGLPESFNFLGGGRMFGIIPIPIVFTIILAFLGTFCSDTFTLWAIYFCNRQQSTGSRIVRH